MRSQGFVATTNAGGAEAPWLPEFSESLAGREVIVIPDNDKPGRDRAARIALALIGRVTRLTGCGSSRSVVTSNPTRRRTVSFRYPQRLRL